MSHSVLSATPEPSSDSTQSTDFLSSPSLAGPSLSLSSAISSPVPSRFSISPPPPFLEFFPRPSSNSLSSLPPRQSQTVSPCIPPKDDLLKEYQIIVPTLTNRLKLPIRKAVDFLIQVVNDNEWQMALRFLVLTSAYSLPIGGQLVHFGKFKEVHTKHDVILLRSNRMGSYAAASALEDVLKMFHPRLVLGIGCAFGWDYQSMKSHDVIASAVIAPYESLKYYEGNDGSQKIENRNFSHKTDEKMRTALLNARNRWKIIDHESNEVKLHVGAVICGEKLIDSSAVKQEMAEAVSHATAKGSRIIEGEPIVGGEMEGSGLALVCQKFNHLPVCIVKGISDWGKQKNDGEAGQDKHYHQRCAAYTAFHLVLNLVQNGDFANISWNIPTLQRTLSIRLDQKSDEEISNILRPAVETWIRADQHFKSSEQGRLEKINQIRDQPHIQQLAKEINDLQKQIDAKKLLLEKDFPVENDTLKKLAEEQRLEVCAVLLLRNWCGQQIRFPMDLNHLILK